MAANGPTGEREAPRAAGRTRLTHPAVAIAGAILLLTVFAIGFSFWPHEDQTRGSTSGTPSNNTQPQAPAR